MIDRMRTAVRIFVGGGCLFGLLVACTGGPGPAGSATNKSGQNGVVERDPSGNDNEDDDRGGSSGSVPPNNAQISVAGYDRSCNADEDCVAVFQGAVCTPCRCPSEPIAKKDQDKYNSDLETKRIGCPAATTSCQPCGAPQVGCNPATKQCGVGVTSADAGG